MQAYKSTLEGINTMQRVKRRFFAMRNGVMTEQLRRSGLPYRIIFGLNMPQLKEIASKLRSDCSDDELVRLSRALWDNVSTRESLLLAPMIMPRQQMSKSEAILWMNRSPSPEVTDNLCHALLRWLPFAAELVTEKSAPSYARLRMLLNLLSLNVLNATEAQALIDNIEVNGQAESRVLQQVKQEITDLQPL